jgi:hypothetical protein
MSFWTTTWTRLGIIKQQVNLEERHERKFKKSGETNLTFGWENYFWGRFLFKYLRMKQNKISVWKKSKIQYEKTLKPPFYGVPARRAIMIKSNRPEGPLRMKMTGPKGHYVWKVSTQKAFGY